MKKYLFVCLMLFSAGAIAELNRWVDERGKVHYSDQPPPPHLEATPLRTSSSPASAPAAPKTIAEREADLKKEQQAKREAAERAAKEQANAETEKSNCNAARQTLRALQEGVRMIEYDANGERRYLEDEERQQRTAKAQQDISKWCK